MLEIVMEVAEVEVEARPVIMSAAVDVAPPIDSGAERMALS